MVDASSEAIGAEHCSALRHSLLAVGAGGTADAVDQALDLGQCHRELVEVVAGQLVAVLEEDLVADALDRQRIDLGAIVLAVATLPALAIGDDLVTRHRDLVAVDGHRKDLRRDDRLRATGAGLLLLHEVYSKVMLQAVKMRLEKQNRPSRPTKGKCTAIHLTRQG